MNQPPNILLVDDEPSLLQGLALHLRRRFRVHTASSGAEGLSVLQAAGPFAVVVSDMRMPGMDGAAFLAQVRKKYPDTIRMLLTGYADLSSAIAAVNEGYIFRFITKPCEPGQMVRLLESGVEQYRLLTADRLLLEEKLAQLSTQLLHAERLATLGTLAGGVGHELNNVAVVFLSALGALDACAREQSPPEEEALAELHWVGEHLRMHASHLLDLGRPGDDSISALDINPVVEDTLSTLRTVGRTKRAKVEVILPPEPVVILGNKKRLEQLLINLVGNAADALSEFSSAVSSAGYTPSIRVSVLCSEGRALVSVADNGPGIPLDKQEEIFKPYFTTKPPGQGTGLGLVVVKRVVEELKGSLSLKSEPNRGATFTLSVPLHAA